MLDHKTIVEYLDYCETTGEFHWKKRSSDKTPVGSRAGRPRSKNGYWQITLKGETFYVHRLAWFYCNKSWPDGEIDHINGVKGDNRISNLRIASRGQNALNVAAKRDNTSGLKNVHWCNSKKRWVAKIKRNGVTKYVGSFKEISDAKKPTMAARISMHGEFANHSVSSK